MSGSLLVETPAVPLGAPAPLLAPTPRAAPRLVRSPPATVVRRLTDAAELDLLYCLRYRAYVDGMRRAPHEVEAGRSSIVDELDDGRAIHLGAFAGAQLRAGLRLNLGSRSDVADQVRLFEASSPAWGAPVSDERIAIGSRFALWPGHESPILALQMARAAYWECLRNDVLRVFVRAEVHLVAYHLSLGFRKPSGHVPEVDGTTALALDPFDSIALRAAGSPLLQLLDAWQAHSPITVANA